MIKKAMKMFFSLFGISSADITNRLMFQSLIDASKEQGLEEIVEKLKKIVPDISNQYTTKTLTDPFYQTKYRVQQAFQMRLFEKAVRMQNKKTMNVVDIGDSAGTHLTCIKNLCNDIEFRTISVNLDEKAVKNIQDKGMEAIHCAAEELDLKGETIDLFTSFQMVEHLMNPCLFFRKLAVRGSANYILVTVPYRESSTVGLHTYRKLLPLLENNSNKLKNYNTENMTEKTAENEHVFELSPLDWKLLMLFAGWRPIYDEIYLQYPKKSILNITKRMWRKRDFEGFWGVILERELSLSNIYKDWEY